MGDELVQEHQRVLVVQSRDLGDSKHVTDKSSSFPAHSPLYHTPGHLHDAGTALSQLTLL